MNHETLPLYDNIKELVFKETQEELPIMTNKHPFSPTSTIYIFGNDKAHMIIDDIDTFQIIVNPKDKDKKIIINGHLNDFNTLDLY